MQTRSPVGTSSVGSSSPNRQHKGGQLQKACQGSQDQGGGSRRAHGGRAHQRREEAGQRQGHEDETVQENVQEGAEGGARKCLHLHPVLDLEEKSGESEGEKIQGAQNPPTPPRPRALQTSSLLKQTSKQTVEADFI